ncbi:MAG: hypothetical protein ACT4QD_06190 [Acidobacteriota bacterium]
MLYSAGSILLAAGLMFVAPASAQTTLVVNEAELAIPFGAAKGQLVLVGDQVVFVGIDPPTSSLSIHRSDIRAVDRSGDVVTITTHHVLRDASGSRDTFRFRLARAADLVTWYGTATAAAAPVPPSAMTKPVSPASAVLARFQAKHDHRIGSCQGTLVLTKRYVGFESIDEINDSRQWQLVDIKEVELKGIYRLKVEPFLGDTFNFELTGKGMHSGEYRRLGDRIARARTR